MFTSGLWTEKLIIETGITPPKTNPDYDPEAEVGCWPFVDHNSEFIREATWHDHYYTLKEQGQLPDDWTREKVDLHFYRAMIKRVIYLSLSDDMTTHDLAKLVRKVALFMELVNRFGALYW